MFEKWPGRAEYLVSEGSPGQPVKQVAPEGLLVHEPAGNSLTLRLLLGG